jgi:hypothetical protein
MNVQPATLEKKWKANGCSLGQEARLLAENAAAHARAAVKLFRRRRNKPAKESPTP